MRLIKTFASLRSSSISIKPAMADISKFKEAMSAVYGPYEDHDTSVSAWKPPERSGGHQGRYLW